MPTITLTTTELETAIDALRDREDQTLDSFAILNEVDDAENRRNEELNAHLVEAANEYGSLAEKLEYYRA
ncbi:MAG: hypothetical protein LC650_03980 [Actinobacteria bacterium]|nr:hypothetical protein [Actinomycetota bacterium]